MLAKTVLRIVLMGCLSMLAMAAHGQATSKDQENRKAVERACLDYVDAMYQIRPELIKRSVHSQLTKFGYWYDKSHQKSRGLNMTYAQLVKLAGQWNKDGRFGKNARRKVVVFDVLDKTASAKLVAEWGIDYLHLVKEDGKWKIRQVLWQSHPVGKKSVNCLR